MKFERIMALLAATMLAAGPSLAAVKIPEGTEFRVRLEETLSSKTANEITPPNIENPRQLIRSIDDRPAPAGFGFVAKAWQPRHCLCQLNTRAVPANCEPSGEAVAVKATFGQAAIY